MNYLLIYMLTEQQKMLCLKTNVVLFLVTFCSILHCHYGEEVRLLNLDPPEAQQYIDRQDTSLKYAPKIQSNVPAVRYLGNEPHNVQEDIYLANQYHGQDGLGGYLYGYAVPDIAKTEKKKAGGDLRGAYNYIAGNGQEIKVEYWDDGTGFHQVDNVPKVLPKQIDDTPEVKAAKEEHQRIWNEQAERNSRPIANPYDSHFNYAQGQPGQAQQLVNQYQQQKQQFPNPGQNVHYQGDQTPQYESQSSQNVNRYQPGGQFPGSGTGQTISGAQSFGGNQQKGQFSVPQTSGSGQFASSQSSSALTSNVGQSGGPSSSGSYGVSQSPGQSSSGQYPTGGPSSGSSQQFGGSQFSSHGQYVGSQPSGSAQYNSVYPPGGNSDGNQQNEGKYNEQEEQQGPPKGFFYSFDYPVGIIVQKDGGPVQKRELKDIYNTNKANFEKQLQQSSIGGSTKTSTGYLYV